MKFLLSAIHILMALSMPILMAGVVNRTKALWAGRKGPRLTQTGSDLLRLLKKQPVFSTLTTPLFRVGAYVVLVTAAFAAMIAPVLGAFAPVQFDHDFVVFAYTLGLARIVLMLSALDVGSSFEGMGAAREASFSVLAEPALFLLLGAASVATGYTSFAGLMGRWHAVAHFEWLVVPAVITLFVLLQVEAARVPVDDPLTHLELTMIHEVMILDHSGPELAAMQYAAALKMTIYAGLIAALLNPFDPMASPAACTLASLLIMLGVAVAVGCVESLTARFRMRSVPGYVLVASGTAAVCLAAVGWGARWQ